MTHRPSSEENTGASTFHPPSIRCRSRAEAVGRCLCAIVLMAGFIAIGLVGASARSGTAAAAAPLFGALCLVPVAVIVVRELRRAVLALRIIGARGPRAISRFRRQLDALPETKHPLGA
jgi:membrane associated rhomboid family serine protease